MRTTTFFKDVKGEWRWRTVHDNGEVTGASTEGYVHRTDAFDNFFTERTNVDPTGMQVDGDGNFYVEH